MIEIPCSIIRGGTTKGVFVSEDVLPADITQRDRIFVALMGSPDPRQIDGLGGADPLTSKVAIVSRSSREGIDVEYESVEVAINEAHVNRGLMCGNLAAGVGYFALAEGLVSPVGPTTTVRIYCRSNAKTIVARMPVQEGLRREEYASAAVSSQTVMLAFVDPAGAVTERLLPTGELVSQLTLPDGSTVRASIVDAGTLYVFLACQDFGLAGTESATDLDANDPFRKKVEAIRVKAAELINERLAGAMAPLSPRRLKVAVVARPGADRTDCDVLARVINPAKVHKAYAVSGAICLGAAAALEGTLVADQVKAATSPAITRIGHPTGVLKVVTEFERAGKEVKILSSGIERTTRVILRGNVFVPV
jgi:methylitaconate Delta-isomerase